jgi:hypothetical protein
MEGFPLLAWKTAVFGSGTPLTELVRRDSNQALLGKDLKEVDIRSMKHSLSVEVENIDHYNTIDLGSGYLPALIRGHITNINLKGKLSLAITLNGKIHATTATTSWQKENAFFTALLPESAFRQGKNELGIYMIQSRRDHDEILLTGIPIANRSSILIRTTKDGGELLIFSDGRSIPVKTQANSGFLDSFFLNENTSFITGWAFDAREGFPVRSIVFFSGKQYIAQTKPGIRRPDIVPFLKTAKAEFSGFQFEIPLHTLTGEKIRAFAITKNGSALELIITDACLELMEGYFLRSSKTTKY